MNKKVRFIGVVAMVLLIAVGIALLTKTTRDQNKRDQATDYVLTAVEEGTGTIEITSPPPDVEGDDVYDVMALEGLAAVLGTSYTPPAEQASSTGSYTITAMGKLEIEKIDLKLPILDKAERRELKHGAGWYPISAEPGQAGNSLLFGHRMKAKGKLFNRLDEMEEGDPVRVVDLIGNTYTYTVREVMEILPEEVFPQMFARRDGNYLSLITCTPVGVASHRLIVFCELTDTQSADIAVG